MSMEMGQKEMFRFIMLVGIVRKVCCAELVLHECPCIGRDCSPSPSPAVSNTFRTFNYEVVVENDTHVELVNVRLERGKFNCDLEHVSERIFVDWSNPYNVDGLNGELIGSLDETERIVTFQITEQGIFSLFGESDQGLEQMSKESFCVRRLNESYSSFEICCGQHTSCIRKCCPYGYVFTNNSTDPCILSATYEWNLPQVLTKTGGFYYSERDSIISNSKIRTGFPNCEKLGLTYVLSTALTKFQVPRRPFRLYDDGTLKFLVAGNGWKVKPENVSYCVDSIAVSQDNLDMTCGSDEQDVLILCSEPHIPTSSPDDLAYRIVYMTGFGFSIIFLLLTAIVHIILWEKQNIHALTILCYVITLTLFYICLLLIYFDETRKRFSSNYTPFIPKELCPILGEFTHFIGIFSFSWLSVINFDLWWTFRVLKPMNQRSFDLKRLLCYASFAIAVPIAVVSVSIALQISYMKRSEPCRNAVDDNTIYPRYGEDGCFLANSAQPYYFYLPVGVLLLANLVFYSCTSCQMLKIYNATRRISSDRNTRKQKQSCELFFKLILVMGTTWIFQVILALTDIQEPTWYSALLDLVNMFQAIAIFIIFVCKRETLRALEQKSTCFKSILHPFRGYYRTPPVLSRSTDGSTKMSRAELTKHNSIESSSGSDHYRNHRRDRDSELISFS